MIESGCGVICKSKKQLWILKSDDGLFCICCICWMFPRGVFQRRASILWLSVFHKGASVIYILCLTFYQMHLWLRWIIENTELCWGHGDFQVPKSELQHLTLLLSGFFFFLASPVTTVMLVNQSTQKLLDEEDQSLTFPRLTFLFCFFDSLP